jgi:translation initiation factor IF-1
MGRRNVQGGNKTKTMARTSSSFTSNKIRIPESEEEEYAVVVAVSGNGRFRIQTEGKKKHMGVLPGSMKGHKKRNNFVQLNSIVLINNRSSWQTVKDECTVDIEHIYSANHIAELGLTQMFQKQLIDNHSNAGSSSSSNNNQSIIEDVLVIFSSSATTAQNAPETPVPNNIKEELEEGEIEEFDIDLI